MSRHFQMVGFFVSGVWKIAPVFSKTFTVTGVTVRFM